MDETYLAKDEIVEEVDSDDDIEPIEEVNDEEVDLENNGNGNYDDDNDDDDEPQEELEPLDDVNAAFTGHKESVLAVEIAPSGSFVISGGQDDHAHIWNAQNGAVIFTCTGHTDSIDAIGVSQEENLVATADMGGLIQVWKNEAPSSTPTEAKWSKIFDYQVDDINWMSFHPVANSVLVVGTAVGTIWMFNAIDINKVKTFQGTNVSCTSGQITPDGTHMIAGYTDGSIRIWDLKSGSVIHSIKDKLGHTEEVNCIDIKKDLAITGSTDGTIKLINLTNGKVLATMLTGNRTTTSSVSSPPEESDIDSVEMVAFCPSSVLPIVASVTVSGCVDLWDLSSHQKRLSFKHEGGVSRMKWDLTDTFKLLTGGLDGSIKVWDARDGRLLSSKQFHYESILDFSISSTGLLVTASDDGSCKVYSDS